MTYDKLRFGFWNEIHDQKNLMGKSLVDSHKNVEFGVGILHMNPKFKFFRDNYHCIFKQLHKYLDENL